MSHPIKPTPPLHGEEAKEFKKRLNSARKGTAIPDLERLEKVLEHIITH